VPTVSIDTFFACSLIVSVAVIATAFMVGTMHTQITSLQDLNKENYLRTIADHIVSSYGSPVDWGSTPGVPVNFGLSANDASYSYKLDIDKISRLNSQNNYSLSYLDMSKAARMHNIALGISLSQMLSINVELSANNTAENATTYTFKVTVSQDTGSTSASLHCYAAARDFLSYVSNDTSSAGVGYVSVQIPTSSNGSALLIVFARASFDDRITAYEVYSFAHLSQEPLPNHTFFRLSPLSYTLNINKNYPDANISRGYALSYAYNSSLTSTSNTTFAIPAIIEKSPIVLVLQGLNDTTTFSEWTAYPQLPLEAGANFANSEENVFVYHVIIKETLYKLALRFGDVIN
jgi:hypothetical protein